MVISRRCLVLALCLATIKVSAQKADALIVARTVADGLIRNNICALTLDSDAISKGGLKGKYYKINNKSAEWRYANGITFQSMIALYRQCGDVRYRDYVLRQFEFYFKNKELFTKQQNHGYVENGIKGFVETTSLDNCGAMTAALIKAYECCTPIDVYMDYIKHTANYIANGQSRLPTGIFCRGRNNDITVWLDDLYMSVSFLSAMGNLTKNNKYFDDAVRQVLGFNDLLYDKTKHLYRHCLYYNRGKAGVACWGRANGWNLFAQATLLDVLPKNHPMRDSLLAVFKRSVEGICEYQSGSGLWHQLLDKSDSYLETSCSAMFAYAIAKGVNSGWLNKDYATVAIQAWKGICGCINKNGDIDGICIGTGISYDLPFYYNRPIQRNDIHGIGAVIFADIEISKLKTN